MSVTNAIWAVSGMAIWVFFWWLYGNSIPVERGREAAFFVFYMLALGVLGFCYSKLFE